MTTTEMLFGHVRGVRDSKRCTSRGLNCGIYGRNGQSCLRRQVPGAGIPIPGNATRELSRCATGWGSRVLVGTSGIGQVQLQGSGADVVVASAFQCQIDEVLRGGMKVAAV